MNFLAKEMKKNLRPFKVWLGPLLFIKILLQTAQLLPKHFPSSISLCILYFLFHKSKDTSTIPQPSVQHLVYISPFSFVFILCFNLNQDRGKGSSFTPPPRWFPVDTRRRFNVYATSATSYRR